MSSPIGPDISPVFVLRSSQAAAKRRRGFWNTILALIASVSIFSSVAITLYQIQTLGRLQHDVQIQFVQPSPDGEKKEPIRFISVAGMYHSGTTALWNSIRNNENVAADKGIDLKAYGMSDSGGYPACGVPLLSDSSVDMDKAMGNSTGISQPNTHLFGQYGTMWGDWTEGGPYSLEGVLKMTPPHKQDVFYTWWKHTPPQHPIIQCFRPDTLYVVMVRHPKTWLQGMNKKQYDFSYEPLLKLWRLIRSNPRRLPPMELRFRSLLNAWEYYINGYLAWERTSAGKNCYNAESSRSDDSNKNFNCLGGINRIRNDKRNIVIVRYEDYLMKPKQVLAQIFSFATRGAVNAEEDENKFVPYEEDNLKTLQDILINLKDEGMSFFSANYLKPKDWDSATELLRLCKALGYSCDDSSHLFINE